MSLIARLEAAIVGQPDIDVEDERHFDATTDGHIPAAVLIAVTDRPQPGVILTQRGEWMRSHAGQVAFPGGKIDASDKDAIDAALREAEEEIRLPRDAVYVIGASDTYFSGSGFRIEPILGLIPPDLPFVINPDEVSDWFEVPLDFLLDPRNIVRKSVQWNGIDREYYEIIWNDRRIWGVTAGIIANLARRF
jgi:8-oxo-dGTP pyrophosphatase MutT (NUDIX family)